MYHFLIPLIFLIGISFTSMRLFNLGFFSSIPFSIILVSIILYLFGLFEFLSLGYYFVYIYAVIWIFIVLLKDVKKGIIFNPTITSSLLFFIFIYSLVYFFNINRVFIAWDEFSHWGPMVQETFRLNRFYSVTESVLAYHKDYPPMITLYETLWMKLIGVYSESHIYMSLQVFAFTLILPSLDMLKKHLSIKDILRYLSIVLFTILVFNSVYMEDATFFKTIYTDGILAIIVAYGLYLSFEEESKSKIFQLSFVFIFLLLSKQVGLFFYGLVLLNYGLYYILEQKLFDIRKLRSNFCLDRIKSLLLQFTGLIVVPLLFRESWDLYIRNFETDRQFNTSAINFSEINGIYSGTSGEAYQFDAMHNFIKAIQFNDFKLSTIPFTYWQLIILVIFTIVIINRISRGIISKRVTLTLISTIAIGSIIYAFLMMLLYVFNFGSYEGPRLASFTRYLNTFWFAVIVLVAMLIVKVDLRQNFKSNLILVGIAILLILAQDGQKISNLEWISPNQNRHETLKQEAEFLIRNTESNSKIFVVCQGCSTYESNFLGYYTNPRVINREFYWIENAEVVDSIFKRSIDLDEYKLMISSFDYLYVLKIDNHFREFIEPLVLDVSNIVNGSLIRIDNEKDVMELVLD